MKQEELDKIRIFSWEFVEWIIGDLYYKFIRLTGKPNIVYEDDEWIYEIDYFDFGFLEQTHIHAQRKHPLSTPKEELE